MTSGSPLLRLLLTIIAVGGVEVNISGCSKPGSRLPPAAGMRLLHGQTLRVAAFPDYLSTATLESFESQTANKVIIETYKSNEELMDRLSHGVRYDVVIPSSYLVERLLRQGQLLPMRRELVANLIHVPILFRNPPYDSGLEHCVPFVWSIVGLGFLSKRTAVGRDPDRWQDLFTTAATTALTSQAKVLMLDDMRATLGVALRSLGHSASSDRREDLLDAQKRLLQQMPRVEDYVEDPSLALSRGESSFALTWSTEMFDLMRRRTDLHFALPEEGTLLYVDSACVLKSSEHPEAAFTFLNHLLDPFVAAELTNATMLATANQDGRLLLEAEARWMWGVFDSLTERSSSFEILRDVGPAQPIYEETWRTVKAALAAQKATAAGQRSKPRAH